MTLVELLVVMSIMVMLVAVSIPVFKPMLESQRTAMAARTVAAALQRTRIKAIEEQKTYGLEFVRFTEGNAQNVSLQLRFLRETKPFVTPEDMRVIVTNGKISVCRLDKSTTPPSWTTSGADTATWNNHVEPGSQIRFGRQGRLYELDADSPSQLASPYGPNGSGTGLTLPDQGGTQWAVEAYVTRDTVATLIPQIVLPRGTVVDLRYSGTSSNATPGAISFSGNKKVAVIFSPAGYVRGIRNGAGGSGATNETLYFCIGEWDRSGDNYGDTYTDDSRCNLLTPSNYWVTVNPKNGQVRITEFAVTTQSPRTNLDDALKEARQFATESARNIGGF